MAFCPTNVGNDESARRNGILSDRPALYTTATRAFQLTLIADVDFVHNACAREWVPGAGQNETFPSEVTSNPLPALAGPTATAAGKPAHAARVGSNRVNIEIAAYVSPGPARVPARADRRFIRYTLPYCLPCVYVYIYACINVHAVRATKSSSETRAERARACLHGRGRREGIGAVLVRRVREPEDRVNRNCEFRTTVRALLFRVVVVQLLLELTRDARTNNRLS